MDYKKGVYYGVVIGLLVVGLSSFIWLYNKLDHSLISFFLKVALIFSYSIILTEILLSRRGYTKGGLNETDTSKKVVAIIPSYDETTEALHATVHAILNQTYPIDKIYVIDDGSQKPVVAFPNERVVWARQKNKGKRHAQAFALSLMNEDEVDFVLTVDSDSVIEKTAIEKMMFRFQEDEELQAITGLVLTRNFRENVLTRLSDLNIALSCIISRPIRSAFGALETTSGALSLYKKELLFDNVENYLTSGTYSDDRQLCYYGVLEGKVVAATDIVVYSDMPNTLPGTRRQRTRWAKGSWKFFPKQMRHLPWKKKIFPIVSMFQVLSLIPLFIFLIYCLITGAYIYIIIFFTIRLSIKYCETALYTFQEKRMSKKEQFFTWLLITPLELLYGIFMLSYVKYKALFLLSDDNWSTRGVRSTGIDPSIPK